ncbi:glycoside hydrolase family 127 protein [Spirosoma sordidisoli]|uniref:Glycosyl hydrolase n=1 Tax=Spirosoma sordidisoli TaxID=2502893 RepID=A0A4Q2UKM4_9BACT|nr:glycoside hydrolase family 127 protein [Spirosoma sordidisoli]RYC68030.1 glycosyl hydrolase [Spirosoma sordidisoli]
MKTTLLHIALLLLTSVSALAQMQAFALQNVRLTGGPFKNAQDVDQRYIMALNPDKLLAPYLIDAGLPVKAPRYGNWESSGLDGHIGGHYLSALAMLYASTGDAELKKRLDYMVDQLAQCQAKNGNGYVGGIPQGKVFWERIHKGDIDGSSFGLNNTWVPLYNIHKLFAGLRDAYEYAGNKQAKQVLIGLGDWFVELIKPLSDEQIQQVLRTEHGGINETFADLYILTKDQKYLETAQRISHRAILEPLMAKQDKLTGLHANTQIPKVIGFEKIATLTGKNDWSEAAQYFWQNVSQTRSVAFGGNSVREHFNPTTDFSQVLRSNQGPETCNSFNMLRLSKALFLDKNDVSYVDFYERTLYNHILSSQHPSTGGFVYFTPIRPNHYRVYSQPETSMWCCVGSGIENHTKYGELIYSHSANDLFVNLFIPSMVNWTDKSVKLTQRTDFPYQNGSDLVIETTKPQEFSLNIRYPKWAENLVVLVNGKEQPVDVKPASYVAVRRKWQSGDKVTVRFNTSTRLEYLPDGSNWAAFINGPIVLAAKTSTADLKGLFADDSRMGHETKGKLYPITNAYALVGDPATYLGQIKPTSKLRFSLDSLTLQPFYEVHDARYQMYFQTFTQAAYDEQRARLKQQEAEALALEALTIDKVNCGEQQPEVDHQYKGEKSDSGYDDEQFWRRTRSSISYQLQNKNRAGKYIDIRALDTIRPETVRFLINEKPAQILSADGKTIRLNVDDTEAITIKIIATTGTNTPRFHQIRLITN